MREGVADGEAILDELIELVGSYAAEELRTVRVSRPERGYVREAGDFVLRIAYHESVHAGQMLGYLRAMGVDRLPRGAIVKLTCKPCRVNQTLTAKGTSVNLKKLHNKLLRRTYREGHWAAPKG